MGILETKNTMCGKLTDEFSNISNGINLAASTINSGISTLKNTLNSFSLSPSAALDAAISDFESAVNDRLPSADSSSLQGMIDFINDCPYLSGDDILKNPSSYYNSLLKYCSSWIFDQVGAFADLFPEFSLGDTITGIMGQFTSGISGLGSGSGLTAGMGNLDKIISCVDALCPGFGSDVSKMISSANSLYGSLNMVSDPISALYGQLDLDSIYSAAGISPAKILAVNKSVNSITGMADKATSAVSTGVDAMKKISIGF